MMFVKMKNEKKKCNYSRLCLHKKKEVKCMAVMMHIEIQLHFYRRIELNLKQRKKKSNHKQRGTLSEFLKEEQHCCSRVVHQGQISLVAPTEVSRQYNNRRQFFHSPTNNRKRKEKEIFGYILGKEKKIYRMASSWPTKPLIGTLGQRPKNGIKTTKSRRDSINKRKCIKWVDSGLRTQK